MVEMNLIDIIKFVIETGINIFKSFEVQYQDYTINFWWFIIGGCAITAVATFVGKILE